jgi:hypothetical protein
MTAREWGGKTHMARPRIAAQAFSLFMAQAFVEHVPGNRAGNHLLTQALKAFPTGPVDDARHGAA